VTDDRLVGWIQKTAATRNDDEPIAMLVRDADELVPLTQLRGEKELEAELRKKLAGAPPDDRRILAFLLLERATQFDDKYGSGSLTTDYAECGKLLESLVARIERGTPIPKKRIAAVDRMIDQVNDDKRVFYSAPMDLAILMLAFAAYVDIELDVVVERVPREVKSYFVEWAHEYASIESTKEKAVASLLYRRELQSILDLWPQWKSGIEKQRSRRN
jgi:hypothetical protein